MRTDSTTFMENSNSNNVMTSELCHISSVIEKKLLLTLIKTLNMIKYFQDDTDMFSQLRKMILYITVFSRN